jgi:hypothetical protein
MSAFCNPRARFRRMNQFLRRRRPQHVPTRQLVQEHPRHAPQAAHPQAPQLQPVLQAAIGFDRILLLERAPHAGRSRHLNTRCRRLRVPRCRQRPVARGAGVDRARPLIQSEVVDRQCLGRGLRRAARDRTDQVHAPRRGGRDVLVAGIERVGQEFLGESSGLLQLVEHGRDRLGVGHAGGSRQRRGDQLDLVLRHAGLGDLDLVAGPLVSVGGGVGVGRVLHAVAAGLGLHHDRVAGHRALLSEDGNQSLSSTSALLFRYAAWARAESTVSRNRRGSFEKASP